MAAMVGDTICGYKVPTHKAWFHWHNDDVTWVWLTQDVEVTEDMAFKILKQ